MGAARVLHSMSDILKTFEFDGSVFFKKVMPWELRLQQLLDLENSVPFCGVEHVLDEDVELCPRYDKRNYRLLLYVILRMPDAPTPIPTDPDWAIKDAAILKARVRDALLPFLLTTLNNHLYATHEGLKVEFIDLAAEDLVFVNKWAQMGGDYMASLFEVLIKNIKEDLT